SDLARLRRIAVFSAAQDSRPGGPRGSAGPLCVEKSKRKTAITGSITNFREGRHMCAIGNSVVDGAQRVMGRTGQPQHSDRRNGNSGKISQIFPGEIGPSGYTKA